jgi:ATP-binding cassette, subfamily B, bacterial
MHISHSPKPVIPHTPIRFLIHVSKPFKGWAFGAILVVILAATLSQSLALFFKWIVEAVEAGNLEKALFYGLLYPVLVLVVQLMYRLSGWFGLTWIIGIKRQIGDELFEYTLGHSHTYFSNRFAGALLNKVTNVIGAVDSLIADFLWSYLATFITMLVTFYFIFSVDPVSGGIFVGLIITLLGINRFFMKQKMVLSKKVAAAGSKLRGVMVDVFSNVGAVRQYSAREDEEVRVGALSQSWYKLSIKSMLHTERTMALNAFVLFVFSGAMFYLLVQRWSGGEVTTAEFIFVLALMSQISGTLIFIGRVMTHYARVMGEAEEGLEELIVSYEIVDSEEAKDLVVQSGEISFHDVVFKYEDNTVFDTFNLTIKPGERVGLVGHSGAGKTTFVSLLLRQHDVSSGRITIDGQTIAEVTQDSLRSHIAVVPQEPMLFHRTIRENISYGKGDATDEEIVAVAKKAQAHEFISQLSEGYDTLVGERGIKLSGGQKQRVAIARAMLKNAPILVLDEATSALDSESEVAIQTALHTLMEGKTVIAVAHRLSTLREMDRILVLENGKIIEDGSHDELAQAGGIYQRLWEHQAGGFLTE